MMAMQQYVALLCAFLLALEEKNFFAFIFVLFACASNSHE